jgi:hypothetical protein
MLKSALFLIMSVPCLLSTLNAQLITGLVEGVLHDETGHPRTGTTLVFTGHPDSSVKAVTNRNGEFSLALTYGEYQLADTITVEIGALQTTRLNLRIDAQGLLHEARADEDRARQTRPQTPGIWSPASPETEPGTTFQGLLLNTAPATVTEPLSFTGLTDNRVGVVSHNGYSWTATQYTLLGMDATDSYQPGRPVIMPDTAAVHEIVLRTDFAQTTSTSFGAEVAIFPAQPGHAWHFTLATADTAAALSSSNLPAPAALGFVQQPDSYHWFTRDTISAGGPVTRWADIFMTGGAQWANQTVPQAAAPTDQHSRLLFGDIRGRIRASAHDQFDALYSGSRINIHNWGSPVDLETLLGRTSSPLDFPGGFDTETGVDHFDFLQVGWTHRFREDSPFGLLHIRYGDSTAHMSLDPPPQIFGVLEPFIEWTTGVVTGAPPLSTLAVRTRQGVEGAWQPAALTVVHSRHQFVFGAGWKTSAPLNRVTIPSDINLTTLNGAPSTVTEFNTPFDSQSIIRSLEVHASDHVRLFAGLSLDLGILADFSRGSLPTQSKGVGQFADQQVFPAQADLISWNSVSPRLGLAWQVPGLRGLVLRGAWSRLDSPLAGRYLDFGNPDSLSANVYRWLDVNQDGRFQVGEEGTLLSRFGGLYSSISPALRQPYADEFNVAAELALPGQSFLAIQAFRRDDKQRIAALDVGVPASAFIPITVPGLTVYGQSPSTLGKDQFLLTNPAGLKSLGKGVTVRAGTRWNALLIELSGTAEQTLAPTNFGNAAFENDPGIVGTLLMDPNNGGSTGRIFVDRAIIGKLQIVYRLGGFELSSIATYTGGLTFNRQSLITGLAQGPFLIPVGANRAAAVANWNLGILRDFRLPFGRIAAGVDILNVTNNGAAIQREEITGPSFGLPTAIQEPRQLRLQAKYDF